VSVYFKRNSAVASVNINLRFDLEKKKSFQSRLSFDLNVQDWYLQNLQHKFYDHSVHGHAFKFLTWLNAFHEK
jgi:hypothetical protein